MNKYLKNYTLFNREVKNNGEFTSVLRTILKIPALQYIVFGIMMCFVGYLMGEKVLPFSWQLTFATTFAYAIAAIGFCLLMGYSGLASLGTGGFIGIGSYSVYYVMYESELSLFLAIFVALIVAAITGIIVGFISLRIEGIYLVILTLGLSEILRNVYMVIEDKIRLKNFELFGFLIKKQHSLYIVSIALVIVNDPSIFLQTLSINFEINSHLRLI